jgi:hypothetical protein
MSFNATAFTIAGTAIAIFGVALYIWDTRKDKLTSTFTSNTTPSTSSPSFGISSNAAVMPGGSRRRKSKNYKKTSKRR